MIQYQIDTPGHNTGQRPTQKHSHLTQETAEEQHSRMNALREVLNVLQELRLTPFQVRVYSRMLQERGFSTDSKVLGPV